MRFSNEQKTHGVNIGKSHKEVTVMRWIIELIDLASNAMIEAQSFGNCQFLSYKKLEQYGEKVVEILRESNDSAVLSLSKGNTAAMLSDFSDFFMEQKVRGEKGICLRDGKTSDDLIRKFRGYLPLTLLLAFVDSRACEVLGK